MKRLLWVGLAGVIVLGGWLAGCRVDVSLDPRVDASPVSRDGGPDVSDGSNLGLPDAMSTDDGNLGLPDAMSPGDAG